MTRFPGRRLLRCCRSLRAAGARTGDVLRRRRLVAALALAACWSVMRLSSAQARPADSFAASHYRIVINVPAKTLEVYAGGQLIRRCPCAVGRPWTPSPEGVYRIINKAVDPIWYNPRGAPVPPGPSNPLGPRWLGVSKPGYGIHGTNVETSVGTAASHGCIRLARDDILWLFDAVPLGTRVEYVYRPAVMSGDPITGFAMIEIAPDLYGRGILTPAYLQQMAAAWGGTLTNERCEQLIASTASGQHAVTDLRPAFICADRVYGVSPRLAGRRVLIPVAVVARALREAGAAIDAEILDDDRCVPAASLDEELGVPLTVSPIGSQRALLSPVVVQLNGQTLPVPGRLVGGEPRLHLPTLAAFIAAAARGLPEAACSDDAAPGPGPAKARANSVSVCPGCTGQVAQRLASSGDPYVSWRELASLFGPGLSFRRCGAYVNLFLADGCS